MFVFVTVVFLPVLELPEELLSVEQQNDTMAMKITIITIKVNMSDNGFEYMLNTIFRYIIYMISSSLTISSKLRANVGL